jgi:methylthioribose-1-phosphate isomerase
LLTVYEKVIMRTVFWDYATDEFKMIDQRRLPAAFEVLTYRDHTSVAKAITDMVVRGAPAIGAAAGFGLALAARESASSSTAGLLADLEAASAVLKAARPTAVNLAWALDRIMRTVSPSPSGSPTGVLREGVRGEGESWQADPIFGKSNLIFTLAAADGLLRIPPDATGLSAGEIVEVVLL